jgi:hypothetical protein
MNEDDDDDDDDDDDKRCHVVLFPHRNQMKC